MEQSWFEHLVTMSVGGLLSVGMVRLIDVTGVSTLYIPSGLGLGGAWKGQCHRCLEYLLVLLPPHMKINV